MSFGTLLTAGIISNLFSGLVLAGCLALIRGVYNQWYGAPGF